MAVFYCLQLNTRLYMYKVYYVCAVLCVCTLCAKCMCGCRYICLFAGVHVRVSVYRCVCVQVYMYVLCAGTRAKNGPPNETYMHIPYTIAQCTMYIYCACIHTRTLNYYNSTNAKTKLCHTKVGTIRLLQFFAFISVAKK